MKTLAQRNQELEQVKLNLFLKSSGVFLGTILCSLQIVWDENTPTPAWTTGKKIGFNPKYWDSFTPESRLFALNHELEHIARLYWLRRGKRDNRIWNEACDYVINQDAERDGFRCPSFDYLINHNYRGMSEEQIYDLLSKDPDRCAPSFVPDVEEPEDPTELHDLIQIVVDADQMARKGGAKGMAGDTLLVLDSFLQPKADWREPLSQFHHDLAGRRRTFSRASRRSQSGIISPAYPMDRSRLAHLAYFIDMSLSTSDEEVQRFLSEIEYIWTTLRPAKMTVYTFTTEITSKTVVEEGDSLLGLPLKGRGGTDLECVRTALIEDQPTAAIILSDMECAPMEELPFPLPILWGVVRNPDVEVPFGTVINLD